VSPSDLNQYCVLNNQARAIIKLYGDFVETYEQRAQAWKAEIEKVKPHAKAEVFTSGSAFRALSSMGPAIIPLVMHTYSLDRSGWWHELLSELVEGEKSSAATFDSDMLYAKWSNWFQSP
jgi:hypothetical protein